MTTLTREAWDRLDEYLRDMRSSLTGSTPADVAEVEQDIRDHVDAELAGTASPVSVDTLDGILRRLGTPGQWASDGVRERSAADPAATVEDRLVYATAGCTILFLAFPPLLVLSWLMARWTLARIEERGAVAGTRRWLLYPPIVLVMAPLGVVGLFWPFAPFAELGGALQPELLSARPAAVVGAVAVAVGGLGAYSIVLGAVLAWGDRLVRFLFYPFAEGFRRRHGWWLMGIGTAIVVTTLSVWLFLRGR